MADLKISALTASTTPLAGTEVLPIVQSSTTKQVSVANLTAGRAVSFLNSTWGTAGYSDGNYLGLGNTNPSAYSSGRMILGNYSDTSATLNGFQLASNKGILTAWADGATNGNGATLSVGWANGGQGPLNLAIGATTTLQMKASGDVGVETGNLVIGTSGKGIDFSATSGSGTSELLSDYEEGTFTPVVVGSSTAGTGTYSLQSGLYTKVGRQVNVSLVLAWSAHTGTGTMSVTGLPFTNTATVASIPSLIAFNLTLTALNTLVGRINTSATAIEILQSPTGGGAWTGVAIDTNVDALIISASYIV